MSKWHAAVRREVLEEEPPSRWDTALTVLVCIAVPAGVVFIGAVLALLSAWVTGVWP